MCLELPPDLMALGDAFLAEAATWLKHFGGGTHAPEDLPAVLPEVAKRDRALVGRLYKVARRFPAIKRMAVHPWLVAASAQLMGTDLASCCHFVNVRMDLPTEEKYLLPIHQDFPYIQGSLNALTWWIPFLDTPLELGPPSWIPGTHLLGPLPVREFDYEQTGASGGQSFHLADAAPFPESRFQHAPVARGEALVFSTLLIHRSEPNQGALARLNVQIRLDDALADESFQRNYPEGLYLGDRFAKSYPEHVRHDP